MRFELLILLVLMAIPLALSQPTFQPSELSTETFSDQSSELFINISNPSNETMYNVHLSSSNDDIQFIINDLNLTSQESKEVKIVVDTETSYEKTSIIDVIYFSKVSVSLEPEDKNVEITPSGYEPETATIVKGSNIIWTNNDDITHSVTGESFDKDILTSETFTHPFNSPGTYTYHDKFSNLEGQVIVKDILGEDLARDPLTDSQFNIHIKSTRVDTSLNIELIDGSNFSVNSNGKKDSVLKLTNIGEKAALNISLKGEWFDFGKDSFLLGKGEETFVTFSILPQIISPNETDKTYSKSIIVEGSNFLPVSRNLSIFIPYNPDAQVGDSISRFFNQTLNEDFLIGLLNTVCKAQPDYDLCKPKIVETIVYQEKLPNIDFTEDEVKKFKELPGIIKRSDNAFNDKYSQITKDIQSIKESLGPIKKSIEESKKLQEKNESSVRAIKAVLIILFILGLLGIGGYFGYKKWDEHLGDSDGTAT